MDERDGIEQRALDLLVQRRQLSSVNADGRADLASDLQRGEDVLEVRGAELVEQGLRLGAEGLVDVPGTRDRVKRLVVKAV